MQTSFLKSTAAAVRSSKGTLAVAAAVALTATHSLHADAMVKEIQLKALNTAVLAGFQINSEVNSVDGRTVSGDAATSWTNAAGGDWATGTNWSLGAAPTAADDVTFGLASTYSVAMPAGAVANTVRATAGDVTLNGGSLALTSTNNPGVGVPAAFPVASIHASGSAQLTIGGGAQVTYNQGYAGNSLTDTAVLNVTGAGTLLTVSTANYATQGRFGVLRGNSTVNVSSGGRVEARLFEFGRQDGAYTATINVNGGSLGAVTGAAVSANTEPQIVLPRGLGATGNLNVTNGGTVEASRLFTGGSSTAPALTPNTANITVSGAGSNVRLASYFISNGGGGAGTIATGTTTLTVNNGGLFSAGFYNINQNGGLLGNSALATTNIFVDGAGSILEAKDSNDFANAYFFLGSGPNSTANMTISNGGLARALTTDTVGGAGFATIGGDRNTVATLNIQTGGQMTVSDQFSVGSSDFIGDGTSGASGTVNISGGGKLLGTGTDQGASSAFLALDRDDTANITVSGAGSEMSTPGGAISFGGGNFGGDFATGGGTTNLTINSGGLVKSGVLILARDPGDSASSGARTTINIDGAGSALKAEGPSTSTTGINDGYITAGVTSVDEFGFPITGSGDAIFAQININVTNGGLLDAEEAMFLGDTQNGSTTITVASGGIMDAGRQLSINTGTLSDSLATLNINSGGIVRTSSSTNQTAGSIFAGTDAASGTSAVTIAMTGAGSTLESTAGIFLGGTFDENNVQTTGIPTTLTAGAGTIITAVTGIDLASNSTMTTSGSVSVAGVSTIGGTWTIGGGAPAAGTLNAVGTGLVKMTNPTPSAATLLTTDNVFIAATAKVDVGMNAMRIRPEGVTVDDTSLADVKTFLELGRVTTGDGGITSSALAANQAVGYSLVSVAGTFLGSPTVAGDILVRATYKGDTNLDGAVNFDDLLVVAQTYGASGTAEWYTGDFTWDGNVNFDDLLLVAQTYNNVLLDGSGSQFVTSSFEGDWALAQSLVPEPASLSMLGLGLAMLGRRRAK